MLFSNCSWMPLWQFPHVSGTFLGLTVELGSVRGSSRCAVWQFVHMAVTTRPDFRSPLPWILSVYLSTISFSGPWYRTAARCPPLWQRAQRSGTFVGNVVDFGLRFPLTP